MLGLFKTKINFNPRPRKEGDITNNVFFPFSLTISIHALVKRATHAVPAEAKNLQISIHALVKRATEYQQE